mmetsp:Transcript_39585/g.118468  ORF Transcript_39585/g.118468 Transcript_39585/m.118468 type:complete len:214 (-) Transcript_39585:64-705(-)
MLAASRRCGPPPRQAGARPPTSGGPGRAAPRRLSSRRLLASAAARALPPLHEASAARAVQPSSGWSCSPGPRSTEAGSSAGAPLPARQPAPRRRQPGTRSPCRPSPWAACAPALATGTPAGRRSRGARRQPSAPPESPRRSSGARPFDPPASPRSPAKAVAPAGPSQRLPAGLLRRRRSSGMLPNAGLPREEGTPSLDAAAGGPSSQAEVPSY